MTENIYPFEYQKSTNLQEHNDIVNKINDIIDSTNDNTREITVMKPQVNTNTQDIAVLHTVVDPIDVRLTTTENDVSDVKIRLTTAENDIVSFESSIANLVKNASFMTDASTTTLKLELNDGTFLNVAMPVVSNVQSGIMNQATYEGYINLGDRVSQLENRQITYPVQFANDSPTNAEILALYTTYYPNASNPPVIGTIVVDYSRVKQFTYDGATWIDTSQTVIPLATDNTPGIVKGSTVKGKIAIEIDGSQSLNGYDDINTDLINKQTEINGIKNTQNLHGTAIAELTSNTPINSINITDSDGDTGKMKVAVMQGNREIVSNVYDIGVNLTANDIDIRTGNTGQSSINKKGTLRFNSTTAEKHTFKHISPGTDSFNYYYKRVKNSAIYTIGNFNFPYTDTRDCYLLKNCKLDNPITLSTHNIDFNLEINSVGSVICYIVGGNTDRTYPIVNNESDIYLFSLPCTYYGVNDIQITKENAENSINAVLNNIDIFGYTSTASFRIVVKEIRF